MEYSSTERHSQRGSSIRCIAGCQEKEQAIDLAYYLSRKDIIGANWTMKITAIAAADNVFEAEQQKRNKVRKLSDDAKGQME